MKNMKTNAKVEKMMIVKAIRTMVRNPTILLKKKVIVGLTCMMNRSSICRNEG